MPIDRKSALRSLLERFSRDESAATAVEYALIGVVMAIMLGIAIPPIRDQIVAMLNSVVAAFVVANA